MKISIKNLGAIKQAEFELGELTVICGGNNTGKTYATHATYGLFDYLRTNVSFPVDKSIIDHLFLEGVVEIPLQPYFSNLNSYLSAAAKEYSKVLYKIFSGSEQHFDESVLNIVGVSDELIVNDDVSLTFGSADRSILNIKTSKKRNCLELSLIVDKKESVKPSQYLVEEMIKSGIGKVVMSHVIPNPFLASAERTGAAIFQKELDFTRNRLLEMLGDKEANFQPMQLLGKFSGEYPLAVRRNVDFIRDLPNISHKKSFISKDHPELLEDFRDIVGGEYKATKEGEIHYHPSDNKRVKLSLVESSSAVRSLLDVGFYLRHIANPGDLLMIDEPELNLHPENQRRVARLFSRLLYVGIKVFITTHSDYIIKEFNTLIMLNQDGERFSRLADREGYQKSELLKASDVRVYIAEKALMKREGAKRKTQCRTLVAATVDDRLGIEARSFDTTIDDMNRIQDEIVWGADE